MQRALGSRALVAILTLSPAAGCHCGSSDVEPIPDEGPLPQLRTGTLGPQVRDRVSADVVGQWDAPKGGLGGSYLALSLDPIGDVRTDAARVVIDGHPDALATLTQHRGPLEVLVRFPGPAPRGTLRGAVYVHDERWTERPLEAAASRTVPSDDELASAWAEAYAGHLRVLASETGGAHPWHAYADRRLRELAEHTTLAANHRAPHPLRRDRVARLMATSTGMASLQEGLQHDRALRVRDTRGERTIEIGDVEPPPLRPHPYDEMLRNLDDGPVPPEPLAAATPAAFWYLRFDSPTTLGLCLDEAKHWLLPARRLADREAHRHDVVDTYRDQLGLEWSFVEVMSLAAASSGVALVGSDPYLREGSDVTAIWATPDADRLVNRLGQLRRQPDATRHTLEHGDHVITVYEHADGLRQHLAQTTGLVIVSNSAAATRAVLDAVDGRRDRLSDEPDFAYMRARDPRAHDAYLFFSDRFIAAVIGPAQKILQSRRQRALSELLTPGYAATLYGWLHAETPASVRALKGSTLLAEDDLVHFDGTPIAFSLASGAASSWGQPSFLTPLIDLPAVESVSEEEARAYESFSSGYQQNWSQAIDPIAAGLDFEDVGGILRISMDARVIPVIEGTSYDDLRDVVADARVSTPPGLPGVRLTWAVGAETRLRRRLDGLASSVEGIDLGLGWLGSWVEVGVLDRRAVAEVAAALDDRVQPPPETAQPDGLESLAPLADAPVYAAAQVRNPAALIAMLAAGRATANAAAPGLVEWGPHARHRGHAIVEVRGPKTGETTPALYYAVTDDAFVVALTLETLQVVLDRLADDRGPRPDDDGSAPQFVLDVSAAGGHALAATAGWLFHAQALESHPAALLDAEVLLRGHPGAPDSEDTARRIFGTTPIGADGTTDFGWTPTGASTPALGSTIAPHFPTLPLPGSPAESMVKHLRRFRAEVGFEQEPGNADRESLRIRVTVESR